MAEEKGLIKYQTDLGEVKLSPSIVRRYLVSGNGTVTDQEVIMFLAMCRYQKLNPFLREAYLIKYASGEAATLVTGKETFLKRAQKNPKYRGHETGISDDGKKAWAKVHVDGYAVPIVVEVDLDEYIGLKKDGTPNRMWNPKGGKPRTMLKKVALVQALREAFPLDLGGLYSPEEMGNNIEVDKLPQDEIMPEAETESPAPEANPTSENEQITSEQIKKLSTQLSKLGWESKEIQTIISLKIKRQIFSRKDLSKEDASRVISWLDAILAKDAEALAELDKLSHVPDEEKDQDQEG